MKIILFCDDSVIDETLLTFSKYVVGIVAASIRPNSYEKLKQKSDELDIPFLIQPKSKSEKYNDFVKKIKMLTPDLILINSYSMILKNEILQIPRKAINIHCSVLPKNRGCNPYQWGIINMDTYAGVTIHEVDKGIDTGKIISQKKIPVAFEDTWITLSKKVNKLSKELLIENKNTILSLSWHSYEQNETQSSYNKRRRPNDGEISWDYPSIRIYNMIRALVYPLPGTFFHIGNDKIEINEYKTINQVLILKYIYNPSVFQLSEDTYLIPKDEEKGLNKTNNSNSISFLLKNNYNISAELLIYNIDWYKKSYCHQVKFFEQKFTVDFNSIYTFLQNDLNLVMLHG